MSRDKCVYFRKNNWEISAADFDDPVERDLAPVAEAIFVQGEPIDTPLLENSKT